MIRCARWRLAGVLGIGLALAACTDPGLRHVPQSELEADRECCTEFSGMTFKPIAVRTSNRFLIGERTPTFEFDEGLSAFIAVQIPKVKHGLRLRVSSNVRPSGDAVFLPLVTLLDESHQPVRTVVAPAAWSDDRVGIGTLLAETLLSAEERYAVVHTDPRRIGERLKLVTSTVVGNAVITQAYMIPFTADGSVTIRVEKFASAVN